jgi:hypothetical protein
MQTAPQWQLNSQIPDKDKIFLFSIYCWDFKNDWSHTTTAPYAFMVCSGGNYILQ